jgi:hypothetical protein
VFYNKKYLFFIVVSIMLIVIYNFIYSFFKLVNINFNFILGFFTFYIVILLSCFLVSLLIFTISKYVHRLILCMLSKKHKNLSLKILWHLFTYLTYITIFIIFFKVTEY